ncbi:alpha-galactosidase [Tessaracoccus sp. G1721]
MTVITRSGVSLLLHADGPGLPAVQHWGAALDGAVGSLDAIGAALNRQTPPATLDAAWQTSLLPAEGDGWAGRPGLQVHRGGRLLNPRWTVTSTVDDGTCVTLTAEDSSGGLELVSRLEAAEAGVVWVCHTLRNSGDSPLGVDWLEATLPVPRSATHLTTLDGRWSREKRPVTTRVPAGSTVRQTRRGRPGHDSPTFHLLSEGEPRWHEGRVWAAHVAWSADVTYRIDRLTEAVPSMGGGEMLRPGEVVLAPGEAYAAPSVAFVFSDSGIDGVADRVHTWLRSRPEHPTGPRPFTLNTWEAVYFDQDPAQLRALADRAASVGVERFVLDDGWFLGRRDDTTSLGDWTVDAAVWPEGLRPLADHVHGLGMQFGLWFEPEMISAASELARAHPDWFLHDARHLAHDPGLSWRTQFVLDLANAEAYRHIMQRISAVVGEVGVDYIKWDHNRDLVEPMHAGRPGTHAHTLAVYRMIDELKARHPGLEIESCSSGGARTDLGIMAHCDRVWASDSNDPVERQDIQRWTGVLLPPELVGAHVGPTESHSSGRVTPLGLRVATSLMGSSGLEWNILDCTPSELEGVAAFAALYKELRPLIHTARVTHPPLTDPAWRVTGFIGQDRAEAVVVLATVAGLEDSRAERLRIPGLDPSRSYRVRVRREIGEAKYGWVVPPWVSAGEVTVPGSLLVEVGLQLPTLWPMQALLLHLVADGPAEARVS